MTIDIDRATSFLAATGRLLDRRRFTLVTGAATPQDRAAVLDALAAYRNADGGYGWGLEPDLRAPESQPVGAQHALEAMAEAATTTSATIDLFDWLDSVTLPDGGLPFALPVASPVACAPFFVDADPSVSSLQITAAVAAQAHRVARFDAGARDHPWLAGATRYCFDEIGRLTEAPFAYVLSFALGLLGAAADTQPEARALLRHLAPFVPSDGALPVSGGAEGEMLRPLDIAGEPGSPLRDLLSATVVARDLDRLEHGQQPDGGWTVDFTSYSAAAALEWRGVATVAAVATVRANGR